MYLPDSMCIESACENSAHLSVFDEIHFTGAFQHLEPTVEEKEGHVAKRAFVSHKKRSKAEVCPKPLSVRITTDKIRSFIRPELCS